MKRVKPKNPHEFDASILTIGADVEFVFLSDYERVDADAVIRGEMFKTAFGCDGDPETVELRPGWDNNVLKLTNITRKALMLGAKAYPRTRDLKWIAGAYPADRCPTGGHLHIAHRLFSNKKIIEIFVENMIDTTYNEFGDTIFTSRLHAEQEERYECDGYGSPLDYAIHDKNRIEYRACPSWLGSPLLALIYYGVTKLCAEAALREMRITSFESGLGLFDPVPIDILSSYSSYLFLRGIEKSALANHWHNDIKENWRIPR